MKSHFLMLIALVFALSSCKKEGMEILDGNWAQTVKVAEGTMVSTFHFNEPGHYILESYIISTDLKTIIQSPASSGSYSLKSSGFSFRSDGSNFDWATKGKVNKDNLTVKVILKDNAVFVKD